MRRLLLASALLLASVGAAGADVLHLKGGRQIVGRVVEDGDVVHIEIAGGRLTLPRDRVERIERTELPREALDRRAKALSDDDVDGWLELADAALRAGLSERRGTFLAAAQRAAPDDPGVRAALRGWEIRDRRMPDDDEASARLLDAHGDGAQLLRTAHFRISYDTSLEVARARGAVLEATWGEFHELAARLGLDTRRLDSRLEVMLFANHDRWAAQTGLADEALAGIDGIFIGGTRRVLLFDPGTSPDAREALATTDLEIERVDALTARLQEQLEVLREAEAGDSERDAKNAESTRRAEVRRQMTEALAHLGEARTALLEQRTALIERSRTSTLATTTHEACHQIAFATRVCRPNQPLWLVEGLATLFEPKTRERFVINATNEARAADLRRLWPETGGGDLRQLVTDSAFRRAVGPPTRSDAVLAYAEAWSLLHYLVTRRPDALAELLRSDFAVTPTARLDAFRRAVGDDLDAIERDWHRHVRRL